MLPARCDSVTPLIITPSLVDGPSSLVDHTHHIPRRRTDGRAVGCTVDRAPRFVRWSLVEPSRQTDAVCMSACVRARAGASVCMCACMGEPRASYFRDVQGGGRARGGGGSKTFKREERKWSERPEKLVVSQRVTVCGSRGLCAAAAAFERYGGRGCCSQAVPGGADCSLFCGLGGLLDSRAAGIWQEVYGRSGHRHDLEIYGSTRFDVT